MRSSTVAGTVALCLISAGAVAQTSPELVIADFVRAAKGAPALASRVADIKSNVAVILVPGILGSKLTSTSQGTIWGAGVPDMSKLKLPANLVDETTESDVQPSLLESYFGDQYGEAFKAIRTAATRVGAKGIACGYDWRRDLRVGAADVERCIQRELGSQRHTLIFVSHSMGGIVTSVWNTLYEQKKFSTQHLVGGIAILGSPLQGSCEIIRMVHEGYKKPEQSTLPENHLEYMWEKIDTFFTGATNDLTGWVTNDIRSSILTWPGAFQLAPKMAKTDSERPCVVLRASENEGDPNIVSYYSPAFWTSKVGKEILRGANPPAHFAQVLAQARDFREAFIFNRPQAPTYAYFSSYWHTPESAMLRPGGGLNMGSSWEMVAGDGRVPSPAGGARPNTDWLSDYRVVYSVHGGIPKDAVFQRNFLKERLKTLVPTLVAYRLLSELGSTPEGLAAYVQAKGTAPVVSDFQGGIDAPYPVAQEPRSALGREIVTATRAFSQRVCEARNCPDTLAVAKEQVVSATDVKSYAALIAGGTLPALERAQARAQIGLANARFGSMSTAGASLGQASLELKDVLENSSLSSRGHTDLSDLSLRVDRNLATSLRETGQCRAAKEALMALETRTSQFSGDLKAKCFDRDTGSYQALEQF